MSEPFLAEVRIFGFNFAPRGWAQCDGQILPINQNQSLYSLLGTTYGGDGRTSFGLPDLRGRVPVHVDGTYTLGSRSGDEDVMLTTAQVPQHDHDLKANSGDGSTQSPVGNVLARTVSQAYESSAPAIGASISPGTVGSTGGGQGHENMMPYTTVNFCMALQGLFPSRN